jgi:6-phosphofructokinase
MAQATRHTFKSTVESDANLPGIIATSNYYIIDVKTGRVIERLSEGGKSVLRDYSFFDTKGEPADGTKLSDRRRLTDREIRMGVNEGRFVIRTHEEILASIDRSLAGIGITGGGDCAGIADFISSLQKHLKPELCMLGVRNAGKGLKMPPEKFDRSLIVVDDLAASDFEGQSSTPFGSAREDPFPKEFSKDKTKRQQQELEQENATANITPFGFFYGTGGNDHMGLLERIARRFPKKVVVGTFKSIDGDGWIAGRPAQMLGFHTAVREYQKAIWAVAQNAHTHSQWHVVETFGRGAGKLAYEAARRYPDNFDGLPNEEQRKIMQCRDSIMLLVPEKPTTLRSLARHAKEIKDREGNVVVVTSEGFMPPELKAEMDRLAKDMSLKARWLSGDLKVEDVSGLILPTDDGDPRGDLKNLLGDRELAAQFGKTVWESKLDPHGNVEKLAGISKFVMAALEKLGGATKVNQILENYEARGATPSEYDRVMGEKIGKKMAQLVNEGVTGGKAVVYFEGQDALTEEPTVVDLVGVTAENNLNNQALYPIEILQHNGVFWKSENLERYGISM